MTIIADTGPIIALAKVSRLQLLSAIFGQIHIPNAVYRELMAKTGDEADEIDEALRDFISVEELNYHFPENLGQRLQQLGKGEKDAILLAHLEHANTLLIMDDKAARNAAIELGIPVTGSVGVIITAKNKGLIPHAGNLLLAMRERGYWLSDKIIIQAKKQAGE